MAEKRDGNMRPLASHHFPQRSSLTPQVPPPSAPDNQRKRSLNEPNDADTNKHQRISSTTSVPQGIHLNNGTRGSPPWFQPPWNVTGHYKVETGYHNVENTDQRVLLNTSTGYEVTIFQYAERQPYQLYARWKLGHLRGLMRFCPFPPALMNQQISFHLKEFEKACNLKPGDAPGPVNSPSCKNKWLMRWRAIETGMGVGKLAGGEKDVNLAFDFIQKHDKSFGNVLAWVMIHNSKNVHFTAQKDRELGPESFSGLTPVDHWASFEAEWNSMFDPKWQRGPSLPLHANPLNLHPHITERNTPLENMFSESVAQRAQQAVEQRDQNVLKQEVMKILSEYESSSQLQLMVPQRRYSVPPAARDTPVPQPSYQQVRNSIPSAARNMTAAPPSREANPNLSQFIIKFELRRYSHDLNDQAISLITPTVIGLLHDQYQNIPRDNISCFHISFDKVKEQIMRFLHVDLTQENVALGFIQPALSDVTADQYIEIKDGLTFSRAVEKLHLRHFSGPQQLTMYLWSPAPTEPIILPRVCHPAIKPAALTRLSQPQQGNGSRDGGAEGMKLLGKRKSPYDFTQTDEEPSNRLEMQPAKHSSPNHGSAFLRPSARPFSQSMTQASVLTPKYAAVSSFISSAESYLASQSTMLTAPDPPRPATASTTWRAPVANMIGAFSTPQNSGSEKSGRPTFVSVKGPLGTSYWTLKSPQVSHTHPDPPARFGSVEISSGSEEDIPATREELLKQDDAKKSSKGKNVPARTISAPRPQENPRSASPSTQLHLELHTPRKKGKSILPKSALNVAPDNQPQSSGSTKKRGRGRPKGSRNKPKHSIISTPLSSPATSITTPGTPINGDGNGKKRRGRPPKVRPSLLGQTSPINANNGGPSEVKTEGANEGGVARVKAKGGGEVEPSAEGAVGMGVDSGVKGAIGGRVEGGFEGGEKGGKRTVENVVEGSGEEAAKGARFESSVDIPVEKAPEAVPEAAEKAPASAAAPQIDPTSFGTAADIDIDVEMDEY